MPNLPGHFWEGCRVPFTEPWRLAGRSSFPCHLRGPLQEGHRCRPWQRCAGPLLPRGLRDGALSLGCSWAGMWGGVTRWFQQLACGRRPCAVEPQVFMAVPVCPALRPFYGPPCSRSHASGGARPLRCPRASLGHSGTWWAPPAARERQGLREAGARGQDLVSRACEAL